MTPMSEARERPPGTARAEAGRGRERAERTMGTVSEEKEAGTTARAEFRPPAWLRLLTNLPLLLASGLLLQGGIAEGGSTLVVGGALSALMLAFVVRSFMLKIAIGGDVTVVNWRGTQRYAWSDVLHFSYDRAGLWLTRRNKERVAVKAFSFGRALPAVQRQGKAVAETLEAARKAHRGPGTARGKKKRRR